MPDKGKKQIPLRLALLLFALLPPTFAVVFYWAKVARVILQIPTIDGIPPPTSRKKKMDAQTRTRLVRASNAWRRYYGAKRPRSSGEPSLTGLVQAGELRWTELNDAWGRRIRVTHRRGQDASYLRFTSPGRDGKFDTFDDVAYDGIDVPPY